MTTSVPASYEVVQYARGTIKTLFTAHSGANRPAVDSKQHVEYFDEYFDYVKAKTVIVECTYIDHDYLDDFAGYYVRCFREYGRFARRLHFFKETFAEGEFTALLAGGSSPLTPDVLQRSYLGFIVVRPLPQSVVGRTCLSTYNDDPRRHFPSTRPYEANLFGIQLTVDTLAFQEQDLVAAACATSALWSVFQGTAMLFRHAIPSPVEITRAGTLHIPRLAGSPSGRAFPNQGLTAAQIAYAVRLVGLEAHVVGVADAFSLQSTAYAYLRGKVPLLLVVELGETIATQWHGNGLHAVAVTGYSTGHAAPVPWTAKQFLFAASRVDKLYAHDDQVGPFARMQIAADGKLSTQWRSQRVPGSRLVAKPVLLLIPLYNKIRIANQRVESIAVKLDSLIEAVRAHRSIGITSRIEWDVHLAYVSDVKAEWQTKLTGAPQRLRLLPLSLPKYLWRVVAIADGIPHLDLLFDATDVSQGVLFVAGVDYVGTLAAALTALAGSVVMPDLAVRAVLDAAPTLF